MKQYFYNAMTGENLQQKSFPGQMSAALHFMSASRILGQIVERVLSELRTQKSVSDELDNQMQKIQLRGFVMHTGARKKVFLIYYESSRTFEKVPKTSFVWTSRPWFKNSGGPIDSQRSYNLIINWRNASRREYW